MVIFLKSLCSFQEWMCEDRRLCVKKSSSQVAVHSSNSQYEKNPSNSCHLAVLFGTELIILHHFCVPKRVNIITPFTLLLSEKELSGFGSRELPRRQSIYQLTIPIPTHLHCKKRLAIFPSLAGMSLTTLSLAGNNLIIPGQGKFGY